MSQESCVQLTVELFLLIAGGVIPAIARISQLSRPPPGDDLQLQILRIVQLQLFSFGGALRKIRLEYGEQVPASTSNNKVTGSNIARISFTKPSISQSWNTGLTAAFIERTAAKTQLTLTTSFS
jgi:hypothetical protein